MNWRIEVKDPLNLQSNVRVFNGSVTATSPDANGKIGAFTQAWNGEDSSGELLVNSTYPIRAQATGSLSAGNILSKEAPTQIMIGALGVKINDLKAEPRNFNPAEGETTTVSFGIEAIGFEDPNLSWEVEVYQNDIRLHSFPVGEALNTSTKDVAIEWDGSTALGPLDGGSFEYRVRATACENGVEARSADPVRQRSLFQVSGGFCSFATDVTEGGITAIEIKNPLVTPDPPFEEPGTTADLTAEIVVSNPQVYRIFWEVGIKDAEGEVVIPEIARGTGSDLLAKWDGIVDPGEDPLTYQFAITAYGCPEELGPDHQPDPETCPLIAKEDVPVGKSLEKLFVEFSGNVVAFGYDQDDDDSQGTLRKTRQEYSRELQRFVGNGATLDFSLEGLLTKPAAVTVQVASSISGQSDTAVLTDEDKDGVYTGSLTLPSNFIQPATGTSYNTGVVYTESGTDRDFADSAMPAYPSPIKLGGYRENLLNPEIEQDSPDEVTTDILSLAELGFENLTIKVVSPATINVETDLNVPNPAKVVAWTFHGYGDGTLLPQNEIGIFVPGANEDVLIPNLHISSGDTQLMDTLFLSACNALNLQNYNQAPISGTGGALEWNSATGGRVALLGYQTTAARTPLKSVYSLYGQELRQRIQSSPGADRKQLECLAWMAANLKYGLQGQSWEDELTLGACALDGNFYYYIPTSVRRVDVPDSADPRKIRTVWVPEPDYVEGVYRIPRSNWSIAPLSNWEESRDNLAEPKPIITPQDVGIEN